MKWWYYLFIVIWIIPYLSGFLLLGYTFQDFIGTLFPTGAIESFIYDVAVPWAVFLLPFVLFPFGRKRKKKPTDKEKLKSVFK